MMLILIVICICVYIFSVNSYFKLHCSILVYSECLSFVTQAGIDTEMLTIALEPEAAAMYVKHIPLERSVDGKKGDVFQTFSSGSKYIVVDAGGL